MAFQPQSGNLYKKTKLIIFDSKIEPGSIKIQIDDENTLTSSAEAQLLGVTWSFTREWKAHIDKSSKQKKWVVF